MLTKAVKAKLPIVHVTTNDTLNAEYVIRKTLGVALTKYARIKVGTRSTASNWNLAPDSVLYCVAPTNIDWDLTYSELVQKKHTLIVINPEFPIECSFDAGVLRVSDNTLETYLNDYAEPDQVSKLVVSLRGLSFRAVIEVSKLAISEYGEFTPKSIEAIRRMTQRQVQGLQQVNTEYTHYTPHPDLLSWVDNESKLLLDPNTPKYLVPKGFLLSGSPGTGKSMAGKYLSKELDIPLYLLELGTLLSKYVGESDKNMSDALNQADACSPCVLLIDEVEKLFGSNEDTGVTSKLLSQLLWWLQERKTRVFVLMTTNDTQALPKELYRPGRIDREIEFTGLTTPEQRYGFQDNLLQALGLEVDCAVVTNDHHTISQADLTQQIIQKAKQAYLTNDLG